MTDVLSKIPLVGWGPIITIAALAVFCLIIAILLWRNHKVWRWLFVFLFLVFSVGAVADYVNTKFSYFDNAADLLGSRPTRRVDAVTPATSNRSPTARVTKITVPDTASHFGDFEANVWLPPQYFTNPREHFPVMLLLHGNPGRPPTG